MKKLKRLEKKEFEEILSERGCSFIKDGIVYNYMDLYHDVQKKEKSITASHQFV